MDIQDPTISFLIRKLLKGCNNLQPIRDCGQPITKDILIKILNSLNPCIPQHSNRILLKEIFLLAFVAFLRLGEFLIHNTLMDIQMYMHTSNYINMRMLQVHIDDFQNFQVELTLLCRRVLVRFSSIMPLSVRDITRDYSIFKTRCLLIQVWIVYTQSMH
jgi:hypothetical protein